MFKFTKILTVVTIIAAMAATSFGADVRWSGLGSDDLWSNIANWAHSDGVTTPVPGAIKTVIGELNYGVAGANDVTLDSVESCLNSFEVYGGAVLTIVAGGSLTVDGGDLGVYIQPAPHGDFGSSIVLAGGSLTVIGGAGAFFNLDIGMFGEAGGTLAGGTGINIDTSVAGQETFTSTEVFVTSVPGTLVYGK